MSQLLSEALGVSPVDLFLAGAFDTFLDDDARFYIDPRLLFKSGVPEMRGAQDDVAKRYTDIIALLQSSKNRGDIFWEMALRLATFKEVDALGLGYGQGANLGRGVGRKTARETIETIQLFLDAGVNDPRILDFLTIVQGGMGADRISDLVANIIRRRLLSFSQRVFRDLGIQTVTWILDEDEIQSPKHPVWPTKPLVLVPHDILADLPQWNTRSEILYVYSHNEDLRDFFNKQFRGKLSDNARKEALRSALLGAPEKAREALGVYEQRPMRAYAFDRDAVASGRGAELARSNPLALVLPASPSIDDIERLVLDICNRFKQLVELNGADELLRGDEGSARNERASQRLFFVVAREYCQVNDVGLTPEANAGCGPVDFKFNRGFNTTVLVEIKLSSNGQIEHGYTTQLEIYARAENTDRRAMVVVDYANNVNVKTKLEALRGRRIRETGRAPVIIWVDASKKPAASKAKTLR